MKKTCFCLLISTCLWKCHSENQGPRVASKDKGGAAQPTEGSQGRACPPPRRQGHRWRTQQALQDVLSLSLSLSLYLVYIFLCFQKTSFWFFGYLIWVFVFGYAERLWGCLLRRFWLWFHRSKRGLWEKLTRRRSTCHSICVPRRLGPLGEGLPSARYVYLRAWFIYAFFFMLVTFYFIGYAISNFSSSIVIVFKVFCVFVYVIKYGVIEKCLIGNAIKFWNIMGELL